METSASQQTQSLSMGTTHGIPISSYKHSSLDPFKLCGGHERLPIKYFEEKIPPDSRGCWADYAPEFRNPSWEDFENNRIIFHPYFNDIAEKLSSKHWCVITGPKKSGKTWLCYALGFYLRRKLQIASRDIRFVTVDDSFDSYEVWEDIVGHKGKGHSDCYYFIEDWHLEHGETTELLEKILRAKEEGVNLRFIFTLRKRRVQESELGENPLFLAVGRDCIFHTTDPQEKFLEFVEGVVRKFVDIKHLEASEEEIKLITEKWSKGHDLVWIMHFLRSFEEEKVVRPLAKLSEIGEKQVFRSVWREDGDIKLCLPRRRSILLPLSALCQFERLSVWPLFIENLPNVDSAVLREELRKENIVEFFSWGGCEYVGLPESWADLILSAYSTQDPNFNRENYTGDILKQYLRTKPPNWVFVFLALHRERHNYPFARGILHSLVGDDEIWEVVAENIGNVHILKMLYLLQILIRSAEKEKARDVFSHYCAHKSINGISQEMLEWEISSVYASLQNISRINREDAKAIVAKMSHYPSVLMDALMRTSGTLQANFLYDILYELSKVKCAHCLEGFQINKQFCPKCEEEVRNEDYPLETSINNLIISLLRKNKGSYTEFYVNFQDKLKSCSAWIVKKAMRPLAIAGVDLRRFFEPFSRSDYSRIMERTYTLKGVESLLYSFLRYYLIEPLDNFTEVFEVSPDAWIHLIDSDLLEDRKMSFNFLWDIYRASPTRARRIVQSHEERLRTGWVNKGIPAYYPAPLGLLHILDFDIGNIPVDQDTLKIRRMLNSLALKPSLLVLSLIALKVKLPSEQCRDLIEMLDEQPTKGCINDNPDRQLRIVLRNLIFHYLR